MKKFLYHFVEVIMCPDNAGRKYMNKSKKYIKFFMLLLYTIIYITISGQGQMAEASTIPPQVSAHSYIVMDANSGKIIFSENKNKRIYPASTVKLMTAIVALENTKLTKKIKIKSSVLKGIPEDAMIVGLKAGQIYSMEQLLNLMLVASAADAAEEIAVASCGSTQKFIKKMNQKAREMGLTGTSFDNIVGLDIGDGYKKTYSTASDIAKLARYAMSIKEIRSIVSEKSYALSAKIIVKNTNQFYSNASYNFDRYRIIGTKTGTTNAAGHVLVSTARDAQGHEIICAFFGDLTLNSTYNDTRELLDYTFNCQDKGKISLSLSYYDVRYRTCESAVLHLCDSGILKMSENGEFNPTAKVKQGDFVNIINQVCNINLVSIKEKGNITVKDFAAILYKAYPMNITEESVRQISQEITRDYVLSQEEVLELAELYDTQILPEKYKYKIDTYITKEDMILISERMKDYVKTLQDRSMQKAS